MGKAVLVEQDPKDARLLLQALNDRGLIMDTWAWGFYAENSSWMLNIATPLADALGLEEPTLSIIRTITELSLSSASFLDLNVFRDTDPFTMALREISRQYPVAE